MWAGIAGGGSRVVCTGMGMSTGGERQEFRAAMGSRSTPAHLRAQLRSSIQQ